MRCSCTMYIVQYNRNSMNRRILYHTILLPMSKEIRYPSQHYWRPPLLAKKTPSPETVHEWRAHRANKRQQKQRSLCWMKMRNYLNDERLHFIWTWNLESFVVYSFLPLSLSSRISHFAFVYVLCAVCFHLFFFCWLEGLSMNGIIQHKYPNNGNNRSHLKWQHKLCCEHYIRYYGLAWSTFIFVTCSIGQ